MAVVSPAGKVDCQQGKVQESGVEIRASRPEQFSSVGASSEREVDVLHGAGVITEENDGQILSMHRGIFVSEAGDQGLTLVDHREPARSLEFRSWDRWASFDLFYRQEVVKRRFPPPFGRSLHPCRRGDGAHSPNPILGLGTSGGGSMSARIASNTAEVTICDFKFGNPSDLC